MRREIAYLCLNVALVTQGTGVSGANSIALQGGPNAASAASGLMLYEEPPGCPSGAARPSVYILAQHQVASGHRRIRPAKHHVNQIQLIALGAE